MKEILTLLRSGNKPALLAGIVNVIIAILKSIAFSLTGNVAMFAEMLHSIGDAANQFFVYIGSALSRKAPTPQFPNGFGRIVNLVCLGAVIVVAIMSYEAVKEGWHHIQNPVQSGGILINLTVLGIAIALEFIVFYKAGKEILHEAGIEGGGLSPITLSFKHLNAAKPPTKLVFMEDLVATAGGILAFIAVLFAHFLGFYQGEGIASVLIGLMMFYVVSKVFLDNARGAIGETDAQMLNHIANLVAQDDDVKDIQRIEVIKEGEFLHVEAVLEVDSAHTVAYIDDIRDRLLQVILNQKNVQEVVISFDEDDGITTWTRTNEITDVKQYSSKFPNS